MTEYAAEQLRAGFRAMTMLVGFVRRGGRPAAIAPTIPLRVGEKQYGWLPVTLAAVGRRLAVITNQRLIVGGEDHLLRAITRVRPVAGAWSVALELRGRRPVLLSGPWVPWLAVVICAELYGTPWPPVHVPAPRTRPVAVCPGRLISERGEKC